MKKNIISCVLLIFSKYTVLCTKHPIIQIMNKKLFKPSNTDFNFPVFNSHFHNTYDRRMTTRAIDSEARIT